MLVFDDINHEVIEYTLNKVAEEFALYGKQSKGIELSFSGGVEVFYQEDEIVKLFNRADHKLYYAKHTGKKKIVFDIDVYYKYMCFFILNLQGHSYIIINNMRGTYHDY